MSRYVVETAQREGEALVVLRDTSRGAEAQIWPGCGNNCFSLRLLSPRASDTKGGSVHTQLVTVIAPPSQLQEIRRRPSWWGIPLLFPFPGTIPRGEYTFEGTQHRLGRPMQPIITEGNERPGTRRDYHGFVMDLPWKVAETRADDNGAMVRSTLDSADYPETMEGFPFPFRVEATYRLAGAGLSLEFRAHNAGAGNLPFGFGAHPFFKVPLGEGGTPGDCLLHIPAAARWNGRGIHAILERGETLSVEDVLTPVREDLDLRISKPFVPGKYNGMYCVLASEGEEVEAFVRDPVAGLETIMRASAELPNVVHWSPPGRDELCFEPWSCPSNVFNLAAKGVPHNGLTVLAPGENWRAMMWIELRETGQ